MRALTLYENRRHLHLHRLEHIHHCDHAGQCSEHRSQKNRAECESRIAVVSGRYKKSGHVKPCEESMSALGRQELPHLTISRTILYDRMAFHVFDAALRVCFVAGSKRSLDCRLVDVGFLVSRDICSIT